MSETIIKDATDARRFIRALDAGLSAFLAAYEEEESSDNFVPAHYGLPDDIKPGDHIIVTAEAGSEDFPAPVISIAGEEYEARPSDENPETLALTLKGEATCTQTASPVVYIPGKEETSSGDAEPAKASRRWPEEMKQKLRTMYSEGAPTYEIAQATGKSIVNVSNVIQAEIKAGRLHVRTNGRQGRPRKKWGNGQHSSMPGAEPETVIIDGVAVKRYPPGYAFGAEPGVNVKWKRRGC